MSFLDFFSFFLHSILTTTNIFREGRQYYKTKKDSEQRLLCGMYIILTIFYLIKKLKDILSKSPHSGTLKVYKTETLS